MFNHSTWTANPQHSFSCNINLYSFPKTSSTIGSGPFLSFILLPFLILWLVCLTSYCLTQFPFLRISVTLLLIPCITVPLISSRMCKIQHSYFLDEYLLSGSSLQNSIPTLFQFFFLIFPQPPPGFQLLFFMSYDHWGYFRFLLLTLIDFLFAVVFHFLFRPLMRKTCFFLLFIRALPYFFSFPPLLYFS